MATVSINSEQIKSIANNLKSKSNEIVNKYKGDCTSAIQMSAEAIKVSGLDIEQFFKALEKIYTKVSDRIGSLSDFLINNVVAEYESVNSAISNNFTNEFAQALSGLIPGVGVASSITSGGSGSASVPAASPTSSSSPATEAAPTNTEGDLKTGAVELANPTPQTNAPVVELAPTTVVTTPQTSAPVVVTTPVTAAPTPAPAPVPQPTVTATAPAIAGSVINTPQITTPNIPSLGGTGGTSKPNVSGLTSGILDFLSSNS